MEEPGSNNAATATTDNGQSSHHLGSRADTSESGISTQDMLLADLSGIMKWPNSTVCFAFVFSRKSCWDQ